MSNYEPVIGLEIHVQLNTKSKMFCRCGTDYRDDLPNTHCCPTCLGLPGALPVPNKKAIQDVILMGLALDCEINKNSYFARKNYFYPDLPKGYQITQYDKPFCHDGKLVVNDKTVGITRIHLEEDTGKSMHITEKGGEEYTLLDFNKSGIPLMELVTEPDFRKAEDVFDFAKKIRQIVRYLDISDGDMEKGNLRVEPNISVRKVGEKGLPKYKVEIKNLNSFTSLKRGVEFEVKRQISILEKGEIPIQETRGWNDDKQSTYTQRIKEEAHDYRYFPEPDIPPIELKESKQAKDNTDEIYLDEIRNKLPELPNIKVGRFVKDFGITEYDAQVLTEEIEIAKWFEESVKSLKDKKHGKKVANWIITEIMGSSQYQLSGVNKLKIQPLQLADLVTNVEDGKISRPSGKEILNILLTEGGDIEEIIQNKGLEQVSDTGALEEVVNKVIVANPKPVADYKVGKKASLQFLIGMVMRETKGKADVKIVNQKLTELL